MLFFWLGEQVFVGMLPLYAAAVIITWLARGHVPPSRRPRGAVLITLLLLPLLLIVWAGFNWGAEQAAVPGSWHQPSVVLTAMAAACILGALWTAWRWRNVARYVLPCALASVLGTLWAWFVGEMAIVNDWI